MELSVQPGTDRERGVFADGRWHDSGSRNLIDVVAPATGALICRIPEADGDDVAIAVSSAKAAFEAGPWADMTSVQRADLLNRVADVFEANRTRIEAAESEDVGMPIRIAQITVGLGIAMIRHCAALARTLANTSAAGMGDSYHAYTRREAMGVVGIITPWNAPFVLLSAKLGPALAAGCTCVIKPAELTPMSTMLLMPLLAEAGVPRGVVNLVVGTGETVGEALIRNPDVAKVSFTGSTRVGQRLVVLAAENLTRLTLELGGKSPMIVLDDADLDIAIPTIGWGVFGNSGEACYACSRVYVQDGIYPEFKRRMVEFANGLKLGAPGDPATDLGPLASRAHREKVASLVEQERAFGSSIVAGGAFGMGDGYYYQPTVLAEASPLSPTRHEEIFGPVVALTPFAQIDEAVKAANETAYGLAAGIFTRNLTHAHRIAQKIRAGTVWINCYAHMDPTQPFGGFGKSGWGREFGLNALDPYLETKSVQVALG